MIRILLKNRVDVIKINPDISKIPDQMKILEHGIPTEGEFAMGQLDFNVLYWTNLSDELSEVVEELLREKKLFYHPSDHFKYLIDGCTLQMPIMKRMPPKGGYKRPHWLPVCLRIMPVT